MIGTRINIPLLLIFFCASFVLMSTGAKAQSYLPVGPQTDVPAATVTGGGWTECYRDTYDNELNAETVLARCKGNLLMLSCRVTGSETLTLLAQAPREDVTFDTGENGDETHIANGTGWYFNISAIGETNLGQNAWGFVRAGDSVDKDNCDVDTSGANDERLCWHLQRTNGGYRCGVAEDLNGSTEFERIVYTAGGTISASIPTLSEWGLIAMAGILGLAGLLYAGRKKATA